MGLVHSQKLPQRFRNARVIGEGALGVVYETWDQVRNESLALKTLHKATPAAIRGFKREFRTVANLSHENLVVLHELFFEDELWFFTMELVRGEPLLGARTSTVGSRLPAPLLREQFVQLARGVNALHQVEVVHRDIKPQNVLVEPTGRVVLLDYGMVTQVSGLAPRADVDLGFAGSPGYMAPEQVFGESLTFASDWYSFGCVLYEGLTGMLPFEDGAGAILMRKLSHAPTPPRELASDVPEDLEALCLGLLERQPERRPDGDEVLRALGEVGPPSRPSVIPSSRRGSHVFVGRDAEVRFISEWLQTDSLESPRVTVLSGPSGIGKTTLAEAVIARLESSNTLVLRSRCLKQEAVPFNAWDGMIDELSGVLEQAERSGVSGGVESALPRLFPVLSASHRASKEAAAFAGDPAEMRSEGMRALRELFLELCASRPVLLFIDDIQWADADSLRLLRELVLGRRAPPLALLVTLRPGEGESSTFEALIREPEMESRARSFEVGPFDAVESVQLLDSLTNLDPGSREAVLAEADGNPFLLTELARGAEQLGRTSRISLRDVLERRLLDVSHKAEALFEVIGVVGRPLPLSVALRAAGVTGQSLEELHRLRASGLIRWGGQKSDEEVETYHDRWRTALEARMSPERRRSCFEALALAYSDRRREEDAEILAACYQECGERELAARHALTAARAAESALAFDRARSCYEMALELGSWSREERIELLTCSGNVANAAGRGARAGQAFREAAALVSGAAQIELLRRAAQAFMSSGHQDEGEQTLREVLGAVGRPPPRSAALSIGVYLMDRWRLRRRGLLRRPRELSPLLRQRIEAADAAAALWMNHNPVLSWTYATRQLRWALDADDDFLLLRAIARELVFAATELEHGQWIEALVALGDGLSGGVEDAACRALYRYALTLRAFLAGDWSEATRRAREVERMLCTECTGVHWELSLARRVYVAAVQIEGDMIAVEALIRDWLKDAEQRDDREAIVTHLLGLGYCHLCRDEPERIPQLLARLEQLVGDDHSGSFNLVWIEAMTLCYEAASVPALSSALSRLRLMHRSTHGRVLLYRVWSRGYEARVLSALAVATTGRERLRWLAELRRLRQQLLGEGWHYATSLAKNVEATLAWFSADRDAAARALEESAELSARSGARLFAAVARLASARVRGDEGQRAEATAALLELNVVDVDRMARAHLPAFWSPHEASGELVQGSPS